MSDDNSDGRGTEVRGASRSGRTECNRANGVSAIPLQPVAQEKRYIITEWQLKELSKPMLKAHGSFGQWNLPFAPDIEAIKAEITKREQCVAGWAMQGEKGGLTNGSQWLVQGWQDALEFFRSLLDKHGGGSE